MSKPKELPDDADCLQVGVTIHPDTLYKYEDCLECIDGDCRSCSVNKSGTVDPMANFLRPRFPFPNL